MQTLEAGHILQPRTIPKPYDLSSRRCLNSGFSASNIHSCHHAPERTKPRCIERSIPLSRTPKSSTQSSNQVPTSRLRACHLPRPRRTNITPSQEAKESPRRRARCQTRRATRTYPPRKATIEAAGGLPPEPSCSKTYPVRVYDDERAGSSEA